jgi:hypothetical protein
LSQALPVQPVLVLSQALALLSVLLLAESLAAFSFASSLLLLSSTFYAANAKIQRIKTTWRLRAMAKTVLFCDWRSFCSPFLGENVVPRAPHGNVREISNRSSLDLVARAPYVSEISNQHSERNAVFLSHTFVVRSRLK